jgi:4-amino-4-deoxy-L-arabinose transferase-like glycosyltransferase
MGDAAGSAAASARRGVRSRRAVSEPSAATIGLVGILLVAAVVRAVWVAYATRQPLALHDPAVYLAAGDQLERGLGYRYVDLGTSAYFPPGFPFALAGVFWLVRHTPLPDDLPHAATALDATLGVLTVALVYVLGRRLLGVGVALTAAALVAVAPNLVYYSGAILSEPLFMVLVLGALAVVLWRPWVCGRVTPRRLVVFGVLVGLAALTRPVGLLLPFALAASTWSGGANRRRAIAQGGISLAAALVVIAPWTVRNAVVMHAPILISANTGDDLCTGHNPDATGKFLLTPRCDTPQLPSRPRSEVRRYRTDTRRAVTYAVHHPGREIELLWLKFGYTVAVGDHDGVSVVESYGDDKFIPHGLRRGLNTIADLWYYAIVALALIALPSFRRGDPRRSMVLLAIVSIVLAPLIYFGGDRFHVPALPIVALVAALPLTRLLERVFVRPSEGREERPADLATTKSAG